MLTYPDTILRNGIVWKVKMAEFLYLHTVGDDEAEKASDAACWDLDAVIRSYSLGATVIPTDVIVAPVAEVPTTEEVVLDSPRTMPQIA